MPAFTYTALDSKGKEKKGVLEGDSPAHVRQLLRENNLSPLQIQLFVGKKGGKKKGRLLQRRKLAIKDLSLLTRQLATLLSSGMQISEALHTVAEQTEKSNIKRIIIGVRATVLEGHSLANGMENFPSAFPPLYCATVAAGENSGYLEKVLERLADFTEKQYYTKQKIRQALIYPALMTIVSIFIVSFLLTYVVPRLITVFQQSGQELPLVTKVLLELSHLLKSYGIYALITIIAVIFIFRRLLRSYAFRYRFHKFLLRIPIIGNTMKVLNTARFARSLGILSTASVPVIEAMNASNNLVAALPIKEAIAAATIKVKEGSSIHRALQQTKYFPPMSVNLIASGEASGTLELMLERVANNQDKDVEILIDNLLTLFEPLLIIVMGAIVLFIVLAILLPIFSLDQFAG